MTTPRAAPWYQLMFTRRMLICVFTGFSSGLPLYLLINLVPAWLKTEGVDIKAIGFFALIQFPYTWKFLWAPLLDRYALPGFASRERLLERGVFDPDAGRKADLPRRAMPATWMPPRREFTIKKRRKPCMPIGKCGPSGIKVFRPNYLVLIY